MKVLPQNHVIRNVYKCKNLGSHFNIKDSTILEHQYDLIYFTQCPKVNYSETYLGKQSQGYEEKSLERQKI